MSDEEGASVLDDAQPSGRKFWSRGKLVAAAAAVAVAAVAVTSYGVVRLRSTSNSSANAQSSAAGSATAGAAAEPGSSDAHGLASISPNASKSAQPSGSVSAPKRYSGYPDASNTGVPAGTKLTNYGGPCTIQSDGVVVDSKTVNCDTFEVRAKNVVIRKSKINGILVTTERNVFSFTLEDSEVNAGLVNRSAVGSTNMTIIRSNIHGGQTSVTCAANCTIRDSYLHGQQMPVGNPDWHLGAFLANDVGTNGRTDATLIHNTIHCDNPGNEQGGGCSGDINLYADFGPISYITIQDSLFGANEGISYCVYGGSSKKEYASGVRNIIITNNVIQRGKNKKCGYWGAVTSFDPSRPGNKWENNRWDDGPALQSEN